MRPRIVNGRILRRIAPRRFGSLARRTASSLPAATRKARSPSPTLARAAAAWRRQAATSSSTRAAAIAQERRQEIEPFGELGDLGGRAPVDERVQARRTAGEPSAELAGRVAVADDDRPELGPQQLPKLGIAAVDVLFVSLVAPAGDRTAAWIDAAGVRVGDDGDDVVLAVAGADEPAERRRLVQDVGLGGELGGAGVDDLADALGNRSSPLARLTWPGRAADPTVIAPAVAGL